MRKQYILKKPKSRTIVEIVCCDDEDWFYDINRRDSKTNAIKYTGMVTKKDVEVRLESYQRDGYIIISETNI